MKQVKLVGLLFGVVLVLGVTMVSSAFALPVVLFEGKPVPTGTSIVGSSTTEGILETSVNKTVVKCKTVNLSGTGQTLGTFSLTFAGCTKGGVATQPCTSVGDATGTILVAGEYHFVYDTLTPALGAGLLLLVTQFHFTCKTPVGNVLLVVKGSVLGLVKEINKLAKTFTLTYTQKEGKEGESTYWNDAGTVQTAQLLTEVSEKGVFEESGDEQAATITSVTVGGTGNREVEVMA